MDSKIYEYDSWKLFLTKKYYYIHYIDIYALKPNFQIGPAQCKFKNSRDFIRNVV